MQQHEDWPRTNTTGSGASHDAASQQANEFQRTAGDVGGEAQRAGGDVKDEARKAAEAVREQVTGAGSEVRRFVRDQAEARKNIVAERVSSLARHAHDTADRVRDDERWLAQLLETGALQLDEVADTIRSRGVESFFHSVRDFAKRDPGLFIGATVAIGFAAARFAQSSAARRRSRSASGYGYRPTGGNGETYDPHLGAVGSRDPAAWPGQPTTRYPSGPAEGDPTGGVYGTPQTGHVGDVPPERGGIP